MSENNTNLVDLKHVLELAEKYKDTEITTLKDGFEVEFNPLFATDFNKKVLPFAFSYK